MTNYTTLHDAALDIASKVSNTGSELYAKTAETIAREAPLLAQEYVRWVFWSNTVELACWIMAVAAFLFATFKMIPKLEEEAKIAAMAFSIVAGGSILIAGLVKGIENAKQITKATVAPRVVLVEWVGQQLKP